MCGTRKESYNWKVEPAVGQVTVETRSSGTSNFERLSQVSVNRACGIDFGDILAGQKEEQI